MCIRDRDKRTQFEQEWDLSDRVDLRKWASLEQDGFKLLHNRIGFPKFPEKTEIRVFPKDCLAVVICITGLACGKLFFGKRTERGFLPFAPRGINDLGDAERNAASGKGGVLYNVYHT